MESTITLEKTYSSCVVELNPETQKQLGIAEGSIVIMHSKNGGIEVEILPPPSAELEALSMYINEEYKDVLEELRRIGD
jgi:formylmethanofuran dehydrogenase subunit D